MNLQPSSVRCTKCDGAPPCDCVLAVQAALASPLFPASYASRLEMLRSSLATRKAEQVLQRPSVLPVAGVLTVNEFKRHVEVGILARPVALFGLRELATQDHEGVCVLVGAVGADGGVYALPLNVEYVPLATSSEVVRRMITSLSVELGVPDLPVVFLAPRSSALGRVLEEDRIYAALANPRASQPTVYIEAFLKTANGFAFGSSPALTLYGHDRLPPYRRIAGSANINRAFSRVIRRAHDHPSDGYLRQSMYQRATEHLDFALTVYPGFQNVVQRSGARRFASRVGVMYPVALGETPTPPVAVEIAMSPAADGFLSASTVDSIVAALDATFGEGRHAVEQCLKNFEQTASGLWEPGRLSGLNSIRAATGLALAQHIGTAPQRLKHR